MNTRQQTSSKRNKRDLTIENINITEEVTNNEEILFELDDCFVQKEVTVQGLKDKVANLEGDVRRYTMPYDPQNSSLENDIVMFRSVAAKYVKKELIDFYIERMRKSASNSIDKNSSTVNALYLSISKDNL